MLKRGKGARAYNHTIALTHSTVTEDDLGHAKFSEPQIVGYAYASVLQMSASKTMLTFQQADVVGLDIEFRTPCHTYNGILWKGHEIHFSHPEDVDGRGRITHVQGWYQADNPVMTQPAIDNNGD